MIRALIFDFDGLILDTESPDYHTWREVYEEHGCELPLETWAAAIGSMGLFDPYADLEVRAGRTVEREEIRSRRRARNLELIHAQSPLPGVLDYLDAASALGLRLGIASSSPRAWVEGHLDRLQLLTRFDSLVCGDEVARVKPDPELYLRALDALGVAAHEALALEDSAHGLRAAHGAGIRCVAVPNPLTRHLPLVEAALRLESLAELTLTAALQLLNGGGNAAAAE